jgi:hypothetical protein
MVILASPWQTGIALNDCGGTVVVYELFSPPPPSLSQTVFVVGPVRPRTQHDYHRDTKVKPEAAIVVIELLMMGGKTLETC